MGGNVVNMELDFPQLERFKIDSVDGVWLSIPGKYELENWTELI